MFENEIVVTKIAFALFMHTNSGNPIHKDRPTHGIVFNHECLVTYSFDDGRTFHCHSGECIYLPKGSNYVAKRYDGVELKESGVYAINFLTFSNPIANAPFVLAIKSKEEIRSLFYKTAMTWQKKDVGYYEECFSLLYRIIKQIRKETERYSPKSECLERISPALKYIDDHYLDETISVTKLAQLCDFSEVYLRRKFQEVFSVSPSVYMRNKRIGYAKELLTLGEYSITDVAMLSGFNDTAYFVREFKKLVGQTPSVYRKGKE